MSEDIVKSAVAGAWPKAALNQSLADYARELDAWTRSANVTYETRLILNNYNAETHTEWIHAKCAFHLGMRRFVGNKFPIFRVNDQGFPAITEIHHMYGRFGSLTRPLGLSVDSATTAVLEHYSKGSSRRQGLHRLRNFLRSGVRKPKAGAYSEYASTAHPAVRILTDILSFYAAFTSRADIEDQRVGEANVTKWLAGELSFVPPRARSISSDITTFCRDLTLSAIEKGPHLQAFAQKFFSTTDAIDLSLAFALLEERTTIAVLLFLHQTFPDRKSVV